MTDHRPEVREALEMLRWALSNLRHNEYDHDYVIDEGREMCDFCKKIKQAQAALAAAPVVEEVVTVDGVYCFKDVMASVLEKTKAGDRVRVVVYREEAE